jgi:hypothetical protein
LLGFSLIGRRPRYYQVRDEREDALVMSLGFPASQS